MPLTWSFPGAMGLDSSCRRPARSPVRSPGPTSEHPILQLQSLLEVPRFSSESGARKGPTSGAHERGRASPLACLTTASADNPLAEIGARRVHWVQLLALLLLPRVNPSEVVRRHPDLIAPRSRSRIFASGCGKGFDLPRECSNLRQKIGLSCVIPGPAQG